MKTTSKAHPIADKNSPLRISVATAGDLEAVYRLRHEVYASELEQYDSRPDGILPDVSELHSTYVIASLNDQLVGFIGITTPDSPKFSVDKYIPREENPISFDNNLYEIRALTVKQYKRGSYIAGILMYAAARWVEAHGGKEVVAIGRQEVLDMYLGVGLKRTGETFKSGAVSYELISGSIKAIAERTTRFRSRLDHIEKNINWDMGIAFYSPSECYHGGAFFDAIGDSFDDLNRRKDIINADVLDAWFPPVSKAQEVLKEHLDWIMRTSPPTRNDGLVQTISKVRVVPENSILTGQGSSGLIFLAFRHWLNHDSRVLILDPSYGEYSHILEEVIRCKVERFTLKRAEGYKVNLDALKEKLSEDFDLFVWVNPNSPTGLHVAKEDVEAVLTQASGCKRIWIDETYIDYVSSAQSMESFAVKSQNTIVCKSMSKVYALSGLRAGYLCGSPHHFEELRTLTPPWAVSLPAQIAATYALQADDYYQAYYQETHELRQDLLEGLQKLGITEIIPGVANFLMFHLPKTKAWQGHNAESVVLHCREEGLYLRNVSSMGSSVGDTGLRIAVKDRETNQQMLEILEKVLIAK